MKTARVCKICGCEDIFTTGNKVICDQCKDDYPDAKQCKSCKRYYPDCEHFEPAENPRCVPCVKRALLRQEKAKTKRLNKSAVNLTSSDTEDNVDKKAYLILKIGDEIIGKIQFLENNVD